MIGADPVGHQNRSDEYDERLRAAAASLRAHATVSYADFLSSPDPQSGEQWDAGQLLAHAAEFGPYWLGQAHLVVDAASHPAPFGRVKSDPDRIAAIERDRAEDPLQLLDLVDAWIRDVVGWYRARPAEDLELLGEHQTLGPMTVDRLVEHFCVVHLEEHAEQLASGVSSGV